MYSYQERAYYLEMDNFLLSKELLAVIKVLIASRCFNENQMKLIINKMETFMSAKDKKMTNELTSKELYHYIPVQSDCDNVLDNVWGISNCIREQKEITIEYYKMDRSKITRRKLKPFSCIFVVLFYLIAHSAKWLRS